MAKDFKHFAKVVKFRQIWSHCGPWPSGRQLRLNRSLFSSLTRKSNSDSNNKFSAAGQKYGENFSDLFTNSKVHSLSRARLDLI